MLGGEWNKLPAPNNSQGNTLPCCVSLSSSSWYKCHNILVTPLSLYNALITLISIWLWIMITLSQLTMTGLSLLSLSWTTDLAPLWASLLSQSRVYTVQVYSAVQLTVHMYSFSLSSALAVWPLARNINYVECGFGGEHEMFLVLPQNIGLSGDFIMAFLSIKVLTETDR